MEEDSKIIDLLYKREEQALIELSEKYGTACKRIAGNILKNHRDAEECVNDTYLAVWNTIPPKNPNPLRAYIFRIIRNISIAKYHENTCIKRNSYYDVALQELENCLMAVMTVEQEMEANELSDLLDGFLETLDKRSRIMFVRRYWYSDRSCRFSEKKEKDREEFYFTKERCCRGFIYTCIYIICFDIGSCGFFSGL